MVVRDGYWPYCSTCNVLPFVYMSAILDSHTQEVLGVPVYMSPK